MILWKKEKKWDYIREEKPCNLILSWGPETGIREMPEACLFFLQFFEGALCIFDLGTWSEMNTLAEGKELPEQRATPEPAVGSAPLLLTQGNPPVADACVSESSLVRSWDQTGILV